MNSTELKTKIAVLVSGSGTNLQALIDAEKNGDLGNGEISLVISSKPDVYALERARFNNIESIVLNRSNYPDVSSYSKSIVGTLQSKSIEIVVLAGFLTIIDHQVYEKYQNKILNVHPSLIPAFCGKGFYGIRVHEAALKKGVKISGATVHIVTPECDAGPIVLQKAVEVLEDDTPQTLQHRIMEEAEWKILPRAVRLLCDKKITVIDNKVFIKGE